METGQKRRNIETPCGFQARVDEDALQDLDVYDAVRGFVSALQAGDVIPDVRGVCMALLGDEGWRAFCAYEKKREGKVRVDHATGVVNAVIEALNSKKK